MLLIVSCVANDRDFPSITSGETTLTFSVNLPNQSKARNTYALTEDVENKVSAIHVLAFQNDKLVEWSEGTSISDNENSSNKKFTTSFSKLYVGAEYKFVLLANSNISELGGLPSEADIDVLLNQIEVSVTDRWNASGTGRDIPMWGETAKDVEIKETMNVTDISLVRMLAKINVTINSESRDNIPKVATDYFELNSVHLYNAHMSGRLVPDRDKFNNKVPSIPSTPSINKVPIEYARSSAMSLTNTIYTFESKVPYKDGKVDTSQLTTLVIGGFYDGETKETFYRLDIKGKKDNEENAYLDLLRNHRYTINIVRIKGSGYNDADEAFNSKPINMEAEIVDWNDGEVGDIHESGDYRLSISPSSELAFYGEAQSTKTININTNAPDGWKVLKITDTDGVEGNVNWLSVDKELNEYIGSDGSKIPLQITAYANDTGDDRVAYIHIKFSRTIVTITATQYAAGKTILEVTSDGNKVEGELLFTSMNDTQAQAIDINWHPSDNSLLISESKSDITWALPIPASAETGQYRLAIKPIPFTDTEKDEIIDRTITLNFEVTNGSNTSTETVKVRHINYAVVPSGLAKLYKVDGSQYNFNMKSNADWKIKSIEEKITAGSGELLNIQSNDNLKVDGKVFEANLDGTPISFTTANTPNTYGAVTVTVESSDIPKKFEDKEIIIKFGLPGYPSSHNGWAGNNIYWDSNFEWVDEKGDKQKGRMTFDDVGDTTNEKYQGLYFKWGSLWGISPKDTWSSDVILYSPDGTSGTATSYGKATWSSILTATGRANDRSLAHLYTLPLDDVGNNKPDVGDICKYLTKQAGGTLHGKKWRMPTSNEFETVASYTRFGSFGTETSNDAAGTMPFKSGFTKTDIGTPSYPASGYRYYKNGALHNVGTYGLYWSSSPVSITEAYYLYFDSSSVNSNIGYYQDSAFNVRCVVE